MTTNQPAQKAMNKRKVRVLMWDVSPEAAAGWYEFFNGILLFGAFLVLAGTWGNAKFGSIKEYFSNEKISENERIANEAGERASVLEVKAEELREANLELEKAVSPRIIEQTLNGEKLAPYSDAAVRVMAPPDFEARRAAAQIRHMLRDMSGWSPYGGDIDFGPAFFPGITVHPGFKMPERDNLQEAQIYNQRSKVIGEALVDVLNENGLLARLGASSETRGEKPVVFVLVGPKPMPEEIKLLNLDFSSFEKPEHKGRLVSIGNIREEDEHMFPVPEETPKE